jgi:hypothetical protein
MDNKDDSIEEATTFDALPMDVLMIIFDYLPSTTKVWVNKTYYMQYRHLIKSMISTQRFNNYVISTVRNDDAFVMDHIMFENKQQWFTDLINNKKYRHRSNIYTCFLYFIYEYAIEQNSNKCRECIEQCATELIGPKWHKKNKASSFRRRWSN